MAESANTVDIPTEEVTDLPSDANAEQEVNPWDASGLIEEDGSIGGYKSIEGLLKSAKESQEYISKLNAEKQSTEAKANNKAQAEEKARVMGEKHVELVNQFVNSGGEMTQEIIDAAEESGIDTVKLELDGMKSLAAANRIFDKVGGKEAYMNMIEVVGADMDDSQKAAFTKDIGSSNSDITLAGLQAIYAQKTNGGKPQTRVSGKSGTNAGGVKPYSSMADMQQDIKYLQTTGRNDKARQELHMARRRATPDSVIFG